jgi:hypothetical protein
MINPDALLTCTEFAALSAYFKRLRRTHALPDLKRQQDGLKRDLGNLYRQHKRADKYEQQIIENNMRPLQWRYQEVVGQIAIIESEPVTVDVDALPERWRVQAFKVGEAA